MSVAIETEQGQPLVKDYLPQALRQLHEVLDESLGPLVDEFMQRAAADARVQGAKTTGGSGMQALQQQLSRALKADATPWKREFLQQVANQLFSKVAAPPPPEEADAASAADITLGKSLLLAEHRYHKLITETEARLNRIQLLLEQRFQARALAPTGLHQAMQSACDALNWPRQLKRPLFNHFEQNVLSRLEVVYSAFLQGVKRVGQEASRLDALERARPRQQPAQSETPSEQERGEVMPGRNVDGDTARMLRQLATSDTGDGYTDGLLAADLLALMDKRPLPGIAKDKSQISLQRLSLAGQYLNEVTSDPILPPELRPKHESIRMPLVKSALADASIFTAVDHPLRTLIGEIMLRSATQRLSEQPDSARVEETLEEVLSRFDLSPDFVRAAMATAEPLEETQVQRFFQLQRQQTRQRKEFVIGEARRMVAEELERTTFGRDVPAAATQFLNKAWGPLLTKRLLQHGAGHRLWKEGLKQADRLIDLLEAREPSEPPGEEWQSLTRAMCEALAKAGLAPEQQKKLRGILEAARTAP